jgi:hypothetical protein
MPKKAQRTTQMTPQELEEIISTLDANAPLTASLERELTKIMELIEDVHIAAIEWTTSCLFFQSRRDHPKLAQGGANVSETNVAQPWDEKIFHNRTPKGCP